MTTNAARIVRVLKVTDTREFEEVGDRFQAIPGSGTTSTCDRCGRGHEVHVLVELEDGNTATVGRSCARADSVDAQAVLDRAIARELSSARKVRELEAKLARARRELEVVAAIYAEVDALEVPAMVVTVERSEAGNRVHRFAIGDQSVRLWDRDEPTAADREHVAYLWRARQAQVRGVYVTVDGCTSNVRALERKLEAVRAKQAGAVAAVRS